MEKTCIQYVKEAAKKLVNSKLQRLSAARTQEIFKGVMQTVGLESMGEVYLFVALFDQTCSERSSNMDDLARYFECSALDMVEYVPALKSLECKGLIMRQGRRQQSIFKQDFIVSNTVMADIIEGRQAKIGTVAVVEVKIDKYEFCNRVADQAENDEVVTDDLRAFVEKMEIDAQHLDFVKQLQADVEDILDRTLFYVICHDNFERDGDGWSHVNSTLSDIFTNVSQRIVVRCNIMAEKHKLMQLGLVCLDDDDMQLTDEGKEYFYGEEAEAFCKSLKCKDIYAFIDKVYDLAHAENRRSEKKNYEKMNHKLCKLEKANTHIEQTVKIARIITDEAERILFYSVGHEMIDDDYASLSSEVRNIFPRKEQAKVINEFKDKTHRLQRLELVEIEKVSSLFGNSTVLSLKDKGKEVLLGEDAALYIKGVSDKQLLKCDKIKEKRLFFSGRLEEQLSLLSNSLDEDHYQSLRARLEEKHLPKGMAALLYGAPGTGKTESVMQMAKATGRAIMHVDISETKTCWFGESEKLIKKVFTDYRRLCEKSRLTPILLFNEADAVFSKRKDVNSGSVAQTENAIQNIILEEMERLDGILIATTNMEDNLDKAFERRFLFKIRFEQPTVEAKTSIWRNKLPLLSPDDAHTLATRYDLSGGQIDNIVRKAMMQEVVRGEQPTLSGLMTMCSEERMAKKESKRIGF